MPEFRLLTSFLARAYLDATARANSKHFPSESDPEVEDARDWFFSGEETPFSFFWTVDMLDINDDSVDKMLEDIKGVIDGTIDPKTLPIIKSFQAKLNY